MSVIAWLLGSRVGRYIAIAGITLAAIAAMLATASRNGANSERAKQTAKSLAYALQRIKTDDQIDKMSRSDRRERLREWMRNE